MGQKGMKMDSLHLFAHPGWGRISFGEPHFRPIFDPLAVPKPPVFKALRGFRRAKMGHHTLKAG